MKKLLTLFTLLLCVCSGAWAQTTLFSQSFDATGAGSVDYAVSTARSYTTAAGKGLATIVGSEDNMFTSIQCGSKGNCGIGINSDTGGNGEDWTGKFGAYYNNTGAKWSIIRTSNLAETAPEAVKITFDALLAVVDNGTAKQAVQFIVGSDFADGVYSYPENSKIYTGFGLLTGSSSSKKHAVCKIGSTTLVSNSEVIDYNTMKSFTWVINNTEDELTYTDPSGNDQTLGSQKWDLWIGTTRIVTGVSRTTTGSSDFSGSSIQNIFIGSTQGVKHEFHIDNIVVTDLTPSGGGATKFTVTYDVNGATTGDAPTDGTEYTSGSFVTVEGKGDLVKTGYTFVGWNTKDDGTGTTYVPGSTFSITSDTELYAQWLTNNTGYDIEAAVQSMESGESTQTFTSLTENNFLYSLSGNSKLDNSTDDTGVFDGLNMKTQNNWIGFGVEAGKLVKIKFGKIKGDSPSVSINFSSKTSMSVATSDEKEFAPANENRYFQIFAEDGQGTVIQKISIIDVVPVTIGAYGYASFASTSALDFTDSGITAYIATANGTDNVTMTEIAKVPANTGVVLKGTKGTVNVPVLTGDANSTAGNLLKPGAKTVTKTEADNSYIYAFGRMGEQVGFVKALEGFTITAGKAYLDLSATSAKGADFLSFVFGDEEQGETDGIKAVTTAVENGVRYNLAGQKVGADYKGIVIVNGKKVIIK